MRILIAFVPILFIITSCNDNGSKYESWLERNSDKSSKSENDIPEVRNVEPQKEYQSENQYGSSQRTSSDIRVFYPNIEYDANALDEYSNDLLLEWNTTLLYSYMGIWDKVLKRYEQDLLAQSPMKLEIMLSQTMGNIIEAVDGRVPVVFSIESAHSSVNDPFQYLFNLRDTNWKPIKALIWEQDGNIYYSRTYEGSNSTFVFFGSKQ